MRCCLFESSLSAMSPQEIVELDHAGFEFHNYLPEDLSGRSLENRFSVSEKAQLAEMLRVAWNTCGNFNRERAEVIPLRNGLFSWGSYPDGEAWVHKDEAAKELQRRIAGTDLYAVVNMEDADDVLAVRAVLDFLEPKRSILGTMYFPYQRGERSDLVPGQPNKSLVILVKTLAKDLALAGVDGLVMVDSHSPAFPWFLLKYGVRALDLTAIPGMLKTASAMGFLDNPNTIVAGGDDGAKEMGYFLAKLTGAQKVLEGKKNKLSGKTEIVFTREELARVPEATVLVGEDIISTGTTMSLTINTLLGAGAKNVVVLATYPIFAGSALEKLSMDNRVKIITTNGRTPLSDLTSSKNITIMKMKEALQQVLELDKRGVNFWNEKGILALEQLGFALAPWQYSPERLGMPIV